MHDDDRSSGPDTPGGPEPVPPIHDPRLVPPPWSSGLELLGLLSALAVAGHIVSTFTSAWQWADGVGDPYGGFSWRQFAMFLVGLASSGSGFLLVVAVVAVLAATAAGARPLGTPGYRALQVVQMAGVLAAAGAAVGLAVTIGDLLQPELPVGAEGGTASSTMSFAPTFGGSEGVTIFSLLVAGLPAIALAGGAAAASTRVLRGGGGDRRVERDPLPD